jgi:hypothetical protein
MAIVDLTIYTGDVPLIGQSQLTFDTNTGDILTYLNSFGADLNLRIGEINADIGVVASNEPGLTAISNDILGANTIGTVAAAIDGGAGIGGGQFVGAGLAKGIQFMAHSSVANESMTIVTGTNGFSIDSFELLNGASLTIEDGATYKVL